MPEDEPLDLGREEAELREGVGRLAQDGALGVAEHAVPGLLRVVRVRPGELDRVLQVLVVDVQELERRLALVEQVRGGDRTGARLAAERDLAQRPDAAPALDVEPAPDLRERVAVLEDVALLGRQQVAGVVLDRLDHAEPGQQLEVEADAHEPAGVGEVAALVDDVADQRARVELGLVGADQQHREPGVVGVREARRLALGVGLHEALDDALVERAELLDVVDLEAALGLRDRLARARQPHAHAQRLGEERREGVVARQVAQREHVRLVGAERHRTQLRLAVGSEPEHDGFDRPAVPAGERAVGAGQRRVERVVVGVDAVDREEHVVLALQEGDRVAGAHPRMARLVRRPPAWRERDDLDRRHRIRA